MHRSGNVLVLLAAATACGAGVRPPTAAAPRAAPAEPTPAAAVAATPDPQIVPAVFRTVETSPTDTALTVAWETGKCQLFHSISVDETRARVVVTVLERVKPDSVCPDAGLHATRTVRLRAPLGGRAVYNGGATPPFPASG